MAVRRLADDASETLDHKPLRIALQQVFFGATMIMLSGQLTAGQRMAAAFVAVEVSRRVRCPPSLRNSARDFLTEQEDRRVRPDFHGVLANATPERIQGLVHTVARGLYDIELPPQTWEDPRSAADLLAEAANRQVSDAVESGDEAPEYDLSESTLRLRSVDLSGFRGSPRRVEVKFEQGGTVTSAILFGENGVGKSTIVDGIEFALQGRIGRSSNFESPVSSSVTSFAKDSSPQVIAALSDGRQIVRRVTRASAGYLVAEPKTVSTGFRLAPITLNRHDILRFLDTDAMERGSLLLDYFPSEAGKLASRPQDEIHRLTADQAELRIRRTSGASRLAEILGCGPLDLADRNSFLRTVRNTLMGGMTWKAFEEQQGWDEVDPATKAAAQELAGIYNELTAIKKRIEAAGNVLNPVAHERQTRILRPILAGIGSDLSQAFNRIAQGYPVERVDVVFAESGPLSLDVVVRLHNGRNCFPQQLFSEAYKDLIALLFFTSVDKKAAERGQAKILILDDVLQSVDAAVRHAFMTYVLEFFADWQLIITAHDRLWRDQLRDLFGAHDHAVLGLEIRDWEFDTGPVFDPPAADRLKKDLLLMIDAGEPRSIAAAAGQLLELSCDRLTLSMRLEIPRQEKYTLADLWAVVRTRLADTAAEPAVQRVAAHKLLRNLTVHPDPRSWDLTKADARAFARAVLDLVDHIRCASCGWLPKKGTCKCGAVQL
ncbi:AAA family ATPase [Amycolatopsis sp. TRM77291]